MISLLLVKVKPTHAVRVGFS